MFQLLYTIIILFLLLNPCHAGTVGIVDEGVLQGWGAAKLNCEGDDIECSKSGIIATIKIDTVGDGINVTYSGGYITSVEKIGGLTTTITRDARNYVTSATDGTRTWTVGRDSNDEIVNITVSE